MTPDNWNERLHRTQVFLIRNQLCGSHKAMNNPGSTRTLGTHIDTRQTLL